MSAPTPLPMLTADGALFLVWLARAAESAVDLDLPPALAGDALAFFVETLARPTTPEDQHGAPL